MALHYTMSLGLQAQATFKHREIRLGQPGAYFFDDECYKLSSGGYVPSCFSLSNNLSKYFSLTLNYTYLYFKYDHTNRLFSPNEIRFRYMNILDLRFNTLLYIRRQLIFFINFGVNFRFCGGEIFLVRYNFIDGIPWEGVWDNVKYKSLGVSSGIGIKYNFIKNFNIGMEVNFAKYFSGASKNHLNTNFFIGYMF